VIFWPQNDGGTFLFPSESNLRYLKASSLPPVHTLTAHAPPAWTKQDSPKQMLSRKDSDHLKHFAYFTIQILPTAGINFGFFKRAFKPQLSPPYTFLFSINKDSA